MTLTHASSLTASFRIAFFVVPSLAVSVAWAQPADTPASPQEALILYGDAANYQNQGAFELAAEEWSNFLQRFQQDPLAPKAQHYFGVCQLQLKQYAAAAEAFQAVVSKHPDFEFVQEAYLNLGWCYHSLAGQGVAGMHARAAQSFSELAEKFPEGKFTDQALFFLGEAEYAEGRKREAIAAYQRQVKAFPKSDLRSDALYAAGVALEELSEHAAAGKAYDVFLKEFREHELAVEVRMRKAETELQAGRYAEAETMLAEVLAGEGFALADHALFRRAYCLSRLDRFADAAAAYGQLVEKYPQSSSLDEATIAAGRCFYRADRYADARTWLQRVLDADSPSAPEAAHWLCRIHLAENQLDEAEKLAQAWLPKAAGSPFLANLEMDEADALSGRAESRPQSIARYRKIARERQDTELAPQALYNAAFTAMEIGQYDVALESAAEFLQAHPDHALAADVRFVVAESRLQRGEHDQATAAFRELVDAFPDHPSAKAWWLRAGVGLFLQKKYEEVVGLLVGGTDALGSPEQRAEARFLIGASQFHLDRDAEAVEALRASREASADWLQADETQLYLSRVLRRQGKLDEATATVRALIDDHPESGLLDQAWYRLGEYHDAAKDPAAAVEAFGKVLAGWPQSNFAPYARYGLGWARFKSRDYAGADESFSSLLAEHPQHALAAETRFARGLCRRQLGKHREALGDLDAYLASPPAGSGLSEARYERGLNLVAMKQYPAAIETLRQLLDADPPYAGADKVLYEIGWAHRASEGAEAAELALAAFARLAKEHPDSPLAAEATFHVGESQYERDEFALAAASYAAARDRSEAGELNEKACYKLGWSQFQQQDYAAALQTFSQLAAAYPQGAFRADAVYMQAEIHYRREAYDAALPLYRESLQIGLPSESLTVLALLHAGQSANQREQWEEAAELLSRIPEQHGESGSVAEAWCELGWARQRGGQEAEAMKAYEEAATRARVERPEVSARARFLLGEVHFNRKDFPEAIRQFQRVMYGYGGDQAAENVRKWQAKSGFEAARCAEVQIEPAPAADKQLLIEETRKYYGYVVEKHPADDLAKQAKTRLQALRQLP